MRRSHRPDLSPSREGSTEGAGGVPGARPVRRSPEIADQQTAASTPKILYTSADGDEQGGALRWLFDMSREIRAWGYGSVLAVQGDPAGHGPPATYVLKLPRPRRGRSPAQHAAEVLRTATSAYRLRKIIRDEQIALVHVNEILDVYGGIAARMARVPCVWHVRADMQGWPYPLRKVLPRIVAALATQVVAVSHSVEDRVFRQQGVRTDKITVIHDAGPDPATFSPGRDGASVREELGVAPDASLVVLVSKLVEQKGHEVLVRAIPRVLRSSARTRFAIVGGELEGAHHRRYADRLKRLPGLLGIEDAVTFTGYRHDISTIMAAADVIVHCSTYPDPFPGVVLQGMAMGRAIIATDVGGATEMIENGISGVLLPPGDPEALAEAICDLIEHPETRASLGRSAAEVVRTRFTADRFYDGLSDLYQSLIRMETANP